MLAGCQGKYSVSMRRHIQQFKADSEDDLGLKYDRERVPTGGGRKYTTTSELKNGRRNEQADETGKQRNIVLGTFSASVYLATTKCLRVASRKQCRRSGASLANVVFHFSIGSNDMLYISFCKLEET